MSQNIAFMTAKCEPEDSSLRAKKAPAPCFGGATVRGLIPHYWRDLRDNLHKQ